MGTVIVVAYLFGVTLSFVVALVRFSEWNDLDASDFWAATVVGVLWPAIFVMFLTLVLLGMTAKLLSSPRD